MKIKSERQSHVAIEQIHCMFRAIAQCPKPYIVLLMSTYVLIAWSRDWPYIANWCIAWQKSHLHCTKYDYCINAIRSCERQYNWLSQKPLHPKHVITVYSVDEVDVKSARHWYTNCYSTASRATNNSELFNCRLSRTYGVRMCDLTSNFYYDRILCTLQLGQRQ